MASCWQHVLAAHVACPASKPTRSHALRNAGALRCGTRHHSTRHTTPAAPAAECACLPDQPAPMHDMSQAQPKATGETHLSGLLRRVGHDHTVKGVAVVHGPDLNGGRAHLQKQRHFSQARACVGGRDTGGAAGCAALHCMRCTHCLHLNTAAQASNRNSSCNLQLGRWPAQPPALLASLTSQPPACCALLCASVWHGSLGSCPHKTPAAGLWRTLPILVSGASSLWKSGLGMSRGFHTPL